jgi:hypothetical protein
LLGRRAKAVLLIAALSVLAVEGVLLVGYYDRYYGSEAASGTDAASSPAPFERTMPEGTMPEGTMPEGTASTGDAPSDSDADGATAFVHRATDGNSRANYTILGDPRTNGDPDAVVLAEPSGSYERNIGVWYVPGENKWSIFNQDLAAVPAGATFEVIVPPADEGFVHRAGPADIFGNVTYLDDPLLNGGPDADVSVTPNWNPGGDGGVYNDHPVGVLYDEDAGMWLVYNEDGARMPEGAAFNVAVSGATG